MNECLVTKLKASVEDKSLRKLGEFRFSKKTDSPITADTLYVSFTADRSSDVEVTILNDGYFCDPQTLEKDTTKGKTIIMPAGMQSSMHISLGAEVAVAPKYGIRSFFIGALKIDLSELSYMDKITSIVANGNGITGSIEVFENFILTTLNVAETNFQVYGNLEKIQDLTNLVDISITKSKVTGDIAKCFGKSNSLTKLNIADSDMTGSIEEFVALQIASGRTSGTISLPYAKACRRITYKGINLNVNAELPNLNATNQFSWTSDGIITWS